MTLHVIHVIFAALLLVVAAKPDARVIGGDDVPPGLFPFAAAINVQAGSSRYFCGGALLRPTWVLTSATCAYNATFFTIQLGSNSLTAEDESRLIVTATEYVVHPDYNPKTLENDVGLIKLNESVKYTKYIKNCYFNVGDIRDGDRVIVMGWGQTSDENEALSENLQYVDAGSVNLDECRQIYGNQVTDNMLCAIGINSEGACTGDNGSPLLQVFAGDLYYVVGIASFVSGNGCESGDPSGYTWITPYYQWIVGIV